MGQYKTLSEAALLIGITPDSLRQRINRGTLKAKKFGKTWVLSKKTIEKIINKKNINPRSVGNVCLQTSTSTTPNADTRTST